MIELSNREIEFAPITTAVETQHYTSVDLFLGRLARVVVRTIRY